MQQTANRIVRNRLGRLAVHWGDLLRLSVRNLKTISKATFCRFTTVKFTIKRATK